MSKKGGNKLTRRQAGGKYGVLMFLVYSVALDYGLVVGDGIGWQGVYGILAFVGYIVALDSGFCCWGWDRLAGSIPVV